MSSIGGTMKQSLQRVQRTHNILCVLVSLRLIYVIGNLKLAKGVPIDCIKMTINFFCIIILLNLNSINR